MRFLDVGFHLFGDLKRVLVSDAGDLDEDGRVSVETREFIGFGEPVDDGRHALLGAQRWRQFHVSGARGRRGARGAARRGRRRVRRPARAHASLLSRTPFRDHVVSGADVMVPMAIPSFGGMAVALITVLIVPTLYCLKEELKLRRGEDSMSSEGERK